METRFEPPQLVSAQVVNIRRYVLRVGGSYLTCVPLLFIPKAAEKKSGGAGYFEFCAQCHKTSPERIPVILRCVVSLVFLSIFKSFLQLKCSLMIFRQHWDLKSLKSNLPPKIVNNIDHWFENGKNIELSTI